MSKKDYIMLTEALAYASMMARSTDEREGVLRAARSIAHSIEKREPLFQSDRFMTAVRTMAAR